LSENAKSRGGTPKPNNTGTGTPKPELGANGIAKSEPDLAEVDVKTEAVKAAGDA
jgi:hypothetical protein